MQLETIPERPTKQQATIAMCVISIIVLIGLLILSYWDQRNVFESYGKEKKARVAAQKQAKAAKLELAIFKDASDQQVKTIKEILAKQKEIHEAQKEMQELMKDELKRSKLKVSSRGSKRTTTGSTAGDVQSQQPTDQSATTGEQFSGKASWYSVGECGSATASGRPLSDSALTAAHKTLKFGTQVRVTNQATGKSVVVEITDRGPYAGGRVLDLSKAGFAAIAPLGAGVVRVSCEVIG